MRPNKDQSLSGGSLLREPTSINTAHLPAGRYNRLTLFWTSHTWNVAKWPFVSKSVQKISGKYQLRMTTA
jgi:hypothetical protein